MPAGRPTKLTLTLIQQISRTVAAGNYIETAAAFAGVTKETLYKWLRRGARAKQGLHREFVDALEKALVQSEMRDVALITAAGRESWQAAAWRLERKFPERWGRKDRVDLRLTITRAVEKVADETGMTPEEVLAEAEALLRELDHADRA